MQAAPTGTKAQQALQLQREQQKAQRQAHAKERQDGGLSRRKREFDSPTGHHFLN